MLTLHLAFTDINLKKYLTFSTAFGIVYMWLGETATKIKRS